MYNVGKTKQSLGSSTLVPLIHGLMITLTVSSKKTIITNKIKEKCGIAALMFNCNVRYSLSGCV